MKRFQRGHGVPTMLYWLVGIVGAILSGSGLTILWWAVRGLLK